ncbi:putative ctr copper transporter [Erysiphe neolycopersici]|uniref:Copper transport protein n=1 Tax=Erysiphe neolycopersici TaxID=212602 RepID=A0A420HSE5_9PEZI|nr:putative ctr copper transporter [Erysiphe neolycopersici]
MDMSGQSGSMSGMTVSSMPMGDAKPMGSMSSMNSDNMSTGNMSMSGMSMSSMSMVFFNSMKTTLYTSMWTPRGISSYAATCVFLIFLASGHRFLFALKSWLEMYWKNNDGSEMSYEDDSSIMKKRKMSIPPGGSLLTHFELSWKR